MSHPLDPARGIANGLLISIPLWVLIILALTGCSPTSLRAVGLLNSVSGTNPETPAVQARGGSTASLSLTTCMITVGGGGQTLTDIVQMLTNGGVLVSAEDGGTSRLVINNCPHPIDAAMIREAGQALRAQRRP